MHEMLPIYFTVLFYLQVSVLLVALLFVFAIIGVQLYGGKLAACNDLSISTKQECRGVFWQKIWISSSLQLKNEEDVPSIFYTLLYHIAYNCFSFFFHLFQI